MEQAFSDTTYTVDLSYTKSSSEVAYDLSSILDNDRTKNKKIFLKLGSVDLNKSQLLSLKSLIMSANSTLALLETNSVLTETAAASLGIIIANSTVQTQIDENEIQKEYISVDNIENIIQEPTTNEINEAEDFETTETEVENDNQQEDVVNSENEQTEEVSEELNNIFDAEMKLAAILDEEPEPVSNKIEELILASDEYTDKDYEIDTLPTMYIKQNLRSGQVINYDGNVIIVGDCNPGCEISATGDITVWGVLGGIAHAGCNGNEKARIRALKMNAIQLRISNAIARKPDSANIDFAEKTNTFTPEEARIINDTIVIFKIND